MPDLSTWPKDGLLIVREERPHPSTSCVSPTSTGRGGWRSAPAVLRRRTARTHRPPQLAPLHHPMALDQMNDRGQSHEKTKGPSHEGP
jgi:hypothetical protein